MAARRGRKASIERTVQAAADTVQAMTETLVTTGLRGMKVVAAMGQAAAKGANIARGSARAAQDATRKPPARRRAAAKVGRRRGARAA